MTFPLVLIFLFVMLLVASIYMIRLLNRARLTRALKRNAESGSKDQVIKTLEKLIEKDPGDYDTWFRLIQVYMENEKFEEAIQSLNRLIPLATGKKGFNEIEANALLADSYMRLKKYGEAFKVYATLHKSDPSDPVPYLQMARIEKERGETEKAINYLTKAQDLVPEDVEVIKELALLIHETKNNPEALTLFQTVLSHKPDDVESHFHIGQMELQLQNYKAAYAHFLKSKNTPDYAAKSLINIGIILTHFGKHEEAQKVLSAAVKQPNVKKEDILEARYQLGETHLAREDLQGAIGEWEKILSTVKEYRDVSTKLELYEHTKTHSLLTTFMVCPFPEFIQLCEKAAKNFAKSVIIIRAEPQRDLSLEIYTQTIYKEMSGPILFKFFRGIPNVGQLAIREFYEKIREVKAKLGVCFTTAEYTEEAEAFATGRMLELHGRKELARLLLKSRTAQ